MFRRWGPRTKGEEGLGHLTQSESVVERRLINIAAVWDFEERFV